MKGFHQLDGLQKSTRMTLLACGCFLLMTALILLFLMFFPIVPEEKQAVMVTPHVSLPEETKQTYEAVEFNWQESWRPLSTWSAGIDGFYRDIAEFTGTKPEETTQMTTSATVETHLSAETDIPEESGSTGEEYPVTPPMPQTTTETVNPNPPEPETDPPAEPEPLPATEPPAQPEQDENAE